MRGLIALMIVLMCLLSVSTAASSADTSPSYPTVVFSDGFESGSLGAWDGTAGTGSVAVSSAAAHSGSYGARLTNSGGSVGVLVKSLPSSVVDSSVSFWARVSSGTGTQTLAMARDSSSTVYMWGLLYDSGSQQLYLYPFNGSGQSTEIATGAGSVPVNTWFKVEVQYTATATGGAQLYVNGQTNSSWGVSGNYTQPNGNLQRVQLWNDSASSTTDFDDVSVATPAPSAPGAPTGVQGSAQDKAVALNWTAPASSGGSSITGYQVTPYVNGVAQSPIQTGSTSTSYTVTGLTDGTAYTFTVGAINGNGTGPDSTASAPVTPAPASVPGAPTGVQGTANDGSVSLDWTAPASNGGSPITGYIVTPYVNGAAQSPIATNSTATNYTVTGLTDGTAYTFTVIAVNSVGNSLESSPSGSLTPTAMITKYTNTVFSDGFESGSLGAWNGTAGTGSIAVSTAAAHTGTYGARLTNASGQVGVLIKSLSAPAVDSSTSFWARVSSGTGTQTLAMARDQTSSIYMWALLYDSSTHQLYFDPYNGSGQATQIATGPNSVADNTWFKVEVQYTATATGGAQLYLNGQTNSSWGVSGNYNQPNGNLQRVQLWNDSATSTTDFDDVAIATPPTVPGAPTNLQGTTQNQAVALNWTAPASNGGSPITGYTITPYINGTAQTPIQTNSTNTNYTVTGLVNGTAYTFTVAATNNTGTGPASTQSGQLTPAPAVPGAPTTVQGTAQDSAVALTWTAPASNGGSPITGYTITPYINGTAQTPIQTNSTNTNYTVTNLTDGTAYTFTVIATNSVGNSPPSTPSPSLTPVAPPTTPGPPTGVQGSAQNQAVALSWTAPGSNGGSQITGYRVTPFINGTAQAPIPTNSTTTTYTVTGLTNGTAYTFVVAAVNANGTGQGSTPSAAVTPTPTIPGAPSGVQGTAQNQGVALNWTAPASNGGSQITGYVVTPYINGAAQTPIQTNSGSTSYTVTGLTNGTAYTFTVVAVNSVGSGPASSPSAPVTPAPTVPSAPTGVQGSPQDSAVALSWTAPSSNGGSQITGYIVTPYINGHAQAQIPTNSTSTTYTVTGLTNGTAYTFTVIAVNAAGNSPESTPSASLTPAAAGTLPTAPTGVVATPLNSGMTLGWTLPSTDGGSPITGYRVTPFVNGTAQTPVLTHSTSTGYALTTLTNGTAYTFKVAAISANGIGPDSQATAPVTPVTNPPNPIAAENQQLGTTAWHIAQQPNGALLHASNHEIEGYASATSVNQGGQIKVMVSTSAPAQYNMDIYRMGNYPNGTNLDGSSCSPSCGGRLMQHIGTLNGTTQPACPENTNLSSEDYGLIECNWSPSTTISIPSWWTTGTYIVKLTRQDDQLANYVTFVVRNDSDSSPIVYSEDTNTWQAYNYWGGAGNNDIGISLYTTNNDVTLSPAGPNRAYTVSFDRPYMVSGEYDGAGAFFEWDYPMIRWLEAQGYDVTYVTDTDLESNPNVFQGHKMFMNVGHDEYYSDSMRANIANGINAGLNMAWFSANNIYSRVTWEADGNGVSLRRIHDDKNTNTSTQTAPDYPNSPTQPFRQLASPQPENQLLGAMSDGVSNGRTFLVSDANSWIFAGTGLSNYTGGNGTTGVITSGSGQNAIAGIVGREFDSMPSSDPGQFQLGQFQSFEPAGVDGVGHSFIPASDNSKDAWADATLYTAPSGGTVFDAGTIQWSWGLDPGYGDGFCDACGPPFSDQAPRDVVNSASQQITKNILNRLSQ